MQSVIVPAIHPHWFSLQGAKPPHPTKGIEEVIFKYFGVNDRFGLLTFCYDKFVKSHFAGVCKELAELARSGDKMAAWVFEQAGRVLAQHIIALSPNFSEELLSQPGGLPIVCIGSVWKSWDLVSFLLKLFFLSSGLDKFKLRGHD
jgi:N-acetylglucosamine kinase